MNCEWCGAEVSVEDGRATRVWCSDECYAKWQAEQERESELHGLSEFNE